jgi:hypothetical protein
MQLNAGLALQAGVLYPPSDERERGCPRGSAIKGIVGGTIKGIVKGARNVTRGFKTTTIVISLERG